MTLNFVKMHGLGNDFIMIDNMDGNIKLSKEQIIFLCDRHKGIGADGVILVDYSDEADAFMNYINADGSEAQMCGNGIRCMTKFLKERRFKDKKEFSIDTRSGIKYIQVHDDDTYSVNMGKESFNNKDYQGDGFKIFDFDFKFISMGNPFAIAFVKNVDDYDLKIMGPQIENNNIFPNRINFELVKEINPQEFQVRVWERGCGETLACGTGACAIYGLLTKMDKVKGDIVINFRGGKLQLSRNKDGNIIMRGPATNVFESSIEIK